MTPLDLVTPLAHAHARGPNGVAAFRLAHAALLGQLARQRRPWDPSEPTLPIVTPGTLAFVHAEAVATALQAVARTADAVGLLPRDVAVVSFVGVGPGDAVDVLPHPASPMIVLAMDQLAAPLAAGVALARGLALAARWHSQALPTPTPWDRLAVLAHVPLAEWVYAEGLAHHLIAALHPDCPAHERLGLSRVAFDRLRAREQRLLAALEADLPERGIGPWARWLDAASPVPETPDGSRPPRGAIGYLSWRLLAARVERVGLAAAGGMAVEG
ncbi:MAG TPA: hypothetical protein VFN90_05060 [Gemmatimonadales bacterium]|nr:hypothetical protein [Gemmatimonadales bacterium]